MKNIKITKPLLPKLESYIEKIKTIWDSNQLTNGGSLVKELERKISKYLEVPYVSLVCNGTIALQIACFLNFKNGLPVITTPFCFPATVNALDWLQIPYFLSDIDYDSMNLMDLKANNNGIKKRFDGILRVNIFGNESNYFDMPSVLDASHCFDPEIIKKSKDDYIVISFHATKLFNTGEGGCIISKTQKNKENVDICINNGIKNEHNLRVGINGKMSEFHAALGLCNLELIQDEIEKRKKVLSVYDKHIKRVNKGLQYFVIRSKKRDYIHKKLKTENIESRKYFKSFGKRSLMQNAYNVSQETLCLPFYGDLEEKEIINICELVM